MGSWNDFNDAKQTTNLIPKGTVAKVHLSIRPGGFDDHGQGWTSLSCTARGLIWPCMMCWILFASR
mgnify:CR=1 FL=1